MFISLINTAHAAPYNQGWNMMQGTGYGMMDGFGWGLGWIFPILGTILLILAIVALARYIRGDHHCDGHCNHDKKNEEK